MKYNEYSNLEKYVIDVIPFWIEFKESTSNGLKIEVKKKYIKNVIKFIKFHTNFEMKILTDIFAVDNISNPVRFCIYYEFISLSFQFRLEIKCNISANEFILSVTDEFKSANWLEREV